MENPDKKRVCETPGKGWEELYRDGEYITFWRRAGTEVVYNPMYDVTSKFPVYQIIKRPSKK
jgi:hypothetical protein